VISQAEVEAELRRRVTNLGGEIEWGCEVAGVGFPGVPLAERFLLVDVHADLPLSRNSIYVWLDGDTVFGAFPLPGPDV
jgi:hypothetical protein